MSVSRTLRLPHALRYGARRWFGVALLAVGLVAGAASAADAPAGQTEFFAGEYAEALKKAAAAVEDMPGCEDGQLLRIEILLAQGRAEAADEALTEALRVLPQSLRLVWLGRDVAFANGRPEVAALRLDQVRQLYGSRPSAYRNPADLVVFGRAVGLRCGETVQTGARQPEITDAMTDSHLARLDRFRQAKGGTPTAALRLQMQKVMQNHCAVYREGETLDEGCKEMDKVFSGAPDIAITDRSMIWNSDLAEAMEFDNLLSQAMVTMYGAANRTESRGAHAREDYSARDDVNWMKHTLTWYDEATGSVKIDYRPVHMNTMSNDVATIPPKLRVY